MNNKHPALRTLACMLTVGACLIGSAELLADSKRFSHNSPNRHTDFARVVNVEPIYRQVSHSVPQRHCRMETVAYQEPDYRNRSHTKTLLGGLIGGAIGNKLGHHKRNKQVGAIAGALLGASIARDIGHRSTNYSPTRYRDEERCEVTHNTRYREEISGYKVTYKYHGNRYYTHMDHHPGKKIKVAVNVSPIY